MADTVDTDNKNVILYTKRLVCRLILCKKQGFGHHKTGKSSIFAK